MESQLGNACVLSGGERTEFFELPLDLRRFRRGGKFKVSVIIAFGICLDHVSAPQISSRNPGRNLLSSED